MKKNWQHDVFADESANFVSNLFPQYNEEIEIRIRLSRQTNVQGIFLAAWPNGEVILKSMKKIKKDAYFDWYGVAIKIEKKVLPYKYILIVDHKEYSYTPAGLLESEVPEKNCFKLYCQTELSTWSPGAVFYQIFPDTFCRAGQTELDQKPFVFNAKEENFSLKRIISGWQDDIIPINLETRTIQYYGGNFKGIQSKIDYLKELGITAVYITPIYECRTNHRYDIIDHSGIDPLLGSEKDLIELIETLHGNDIKIIFDAVLNHTGLFHPWFDLLGEYQTPGAFRSKDSAYFDYYYFYEHPYDYACWLGARELPQLNLKNKNVRQKLISGENSSLKKWLKKPFLIDGWRFDTANILGKHACENFDAELTRLMHESIKQENRESYIVAETFYDPAELIGHDRYEGAMNYRGFFKPLVEWLVGKLTISPHDEPEQVFQLHTNAQYFSRQIKAVRSMMPFQNQIRMLNSINTHDTARFLTEVSQDFNKLKLAVVFLFTYIGIPCVYYGDEVGLSGGNDPYNRKPMPWQADQQNREIFAFYQKMIRLRKNYRSLQQGSYWELLAKDQLLVFTRFLKDETIIVMINAGDQKEQASLPVDRLGLTKTILRDYMTDEEYAIENNQLQVCIKKSDFKILI